MIRKFAIAVAAVAAFGALSLTASTPAAAWKGFHHHHHGHHHHHHGFHWRHHHGFHGVSYNSCLRRRWVVNRFGEVVLRVVNVCY